MTSSINGRLLSLEDYLCLRRKFLVYNLILRNLKVRYRKSLFGMIWTVLIPAGSAAVYYVVFSFVLKVKVEHHLLFILSGIIPWTFFSGALTSGLESIVYNFNLLNKIPLPIQSLPLSEAMTHFLNLLLSLPVLLAVMALTKFLPTWSILQYFPLLILLFFLSYSLGLIFSLLFVYFRDLKFLMTLVLQFWFYLTPIMYTADMVPEKAQFAIALNPIGVLFKGLGSCITENYWLSAREWAIVIGWTLAITLVAKIAFQRLRDSIVETV